MISFIPNSFDNNSFVWQDAIRARVEVRERRLNKPAKGCKETFSIGQQVVLQDHISKKWDIPGQITKIRLAHDEKFLSYEIRTDKGHLTTRHRIMIKAIPKVNIEANIVPAIVDALDDDSKTPDPENIWSRGDRLRAKTVTIHEADDLMLKTSSHEKPSYAGEDFHSQISISSMKAVSSSSNQVATVAGIPSEPGGESSDLPADSE